MGPEYRSLQLFVEPAHFGHTGMRRKRTFIFLWHSETCTHLGLIMVEASFSDLFWWFWGRVQCQMTWE